MNSVCRREHLTEYVVLNVEPVKKTEVRYCIKGLIDVLFLFVLVSYNGRISVIRPSLTGTSKGTFCLWEAGSAARHNLPSRGKMALADVEALHNSLFL